MRSWKAALSRLGTPRRRTPLLYCQRSFCRGKSQFALANNFNPTVFAAESLGSALSTQASFQSFVGLNVSQFAQSVSTLTGVNVSAIQTFVTNWQNFFTRQPRSPSGPDRYAGILWLSLR